MIIASYGTVTIGKEYKIMKPQKYKPSKNEYINLKNITLIKTAHMKQLGKKIINLLLIFIIMTIISCKKNVSKKVVDANFSLKEKEQTKNCLQKQDSLKIKKFANSLIVDLKKDIIFCKNYLYKGYDNPDITALKNLTKYKIISIDINFEKKNDKTCNEVYINFIVLTEIFTDDEGNNHNVEDSITLKIENIHSKIKIFKIFVSG
ncbi:MAG: hypothetical protein L3J23_02080 [Flavobacteriaceae bacterium]|nr:hypothetical protein [Flavobacteriaceae bacterium]